MSNSFIQPSSISPASCIAFTSYSSASVTTSASFPFATSSACLPLPPCDCITSTSCPVCPCQCSAKSSLYALYNSLVGSYDTFVIVTDFSVLVSALFPQPASTVTAKIDVNNILKIFFFINSLPRYNIKFIFLSPLSHTHSATHLSIYHAFSVQIFSHNRCLLCYSYFSYGI